MTLTFPCNLSQELSVLSHEQWSPQLPIRLEGVRQYYPADAEENERIDGCLMAGI